MRPVSDLTIVIGPPGPPEEKRKFDGWSASSGKKASEIWVEYVHQVLGSLASREANDEASKLDEIVSQVVGTRVTITDPFMTYTFADGARVPGLMICVNRIQDVNGDQLRIDWSEQRIREAISSVLGMILKAEWVRSYVAYGKE